MSELPVAGTNVELAREIRPDAASAPQLRVIILGLPGFGWRAKAAHVVGERSDLLRVTVSAPFASIDDSAPLFGGGERRHGDRSHLLNALLQLLAWKDREHKERKREKKSSQNPTMERKWLKMARRVVAGIT
jgi:hypothetical protein